MRLTDEPLKLYVPDIDKEDVKDIKDIIPEDFLNLIADSETNIANNALVKEITNYKESDTDNFDSDKGKPIVKEETIIKKVTPIDVPNSSNSSPKKQVIEFLGAQEKMNLSTLYATLIVTGTNMCAEMFELKSRVSEENSTILKTAFNDHYSNKDIDVKTSKGALILALLVVISPILFEAGSKIYKNIKTKRDESKHNIPTPLAPKKKIIVEDKEVKETIVKEEKKVKNVMSKVVKPKIVKKRAIKETSINLKRGTKI